MTSLHTNLGIGSARVPSAPARLAFRIIACFLCGPPVFPQPADVLESGTEFARKIEPGVVHVYRLRFEQERQCAQAVLEQQGVDLFADFKSGGDLVYRLDSRWHGAESLTLIAASAGEHLLEIKRVSASGSGGAYLLKTSGPVPCSTQHERGLTAQKLATRLKELVTKGMAQSQQEALAIAEQAAAAWRDAGDRSGEAQARNTLGFVQNALGKSAEAIRQYETALELWRAAGDRSGQGEALHNMAAALNALGDREKALEKYELALTHRRASHDSAGEGTTLANLANLYQAAGRIDDALDALSVALKLHRRTGDVVGETQCLIGLGTVHAHRGELQKGLDYYGEALPLLDRGGNLRGHAYVLLNAGKLYADLGEPELGLRHLRDAASRMRKVGDKRGEAVAFNRIAAILLARKDPRGALENSRRALGLAEEVRDPWTASMTLTTMARAHDALSERDQALTLARRALSDLETLRDQRGIALARHLLGVLHYRGGETEVALEHLQRAVDLWPEKSPGRANSLLWQARVRYAAGRPDEACSHARQALEIVEASRGELVGEQLRASYVASQYDYYQLYIEILMALHRKDAAKGWDARALEISERARARTLLEALTGTRAHIRQDIEPELLARETRLRREINTLAARVSAQESGPKVRADAESKLGSLLAELSFAEAEIRRRSPRFASLTQPETLTLERIQREVLDENTVLLEYALGEERSYLWTAGANFLKSFELPKRADIEAMTVALRELLSRVEETRETESWHAEWETVAGRLAGVLLAPAVRDINGKRLLIVAEGPLHYVPFAALLLAPRLKDRALANEIVRLPSASTLAALRKERLHRAAPSKSVAVFADPVYEPGDPRVRLAASQRELAATAIGSRDGMRVRRLPFTRQEAARILAVVPRKQSAIRVGFDANRREVASVRLRDFRTVHFAAHAVINDLHPELSGIVLSLLDKQGRPQDGFLRLHDIYNLTLPIDLVVLSACQSALGTSVRGEGMVGLTRGFMYAGAASVLASLWKVDDAATAELMASFYQNMFRRGLTPAAALRAAQAELARQRRWEHPFYWAGFALHGDWR